MADGLDALMVIFTEFYYWVTVVMMFLIHVGFCVYEVGASRRKNIQHTLMKNTMLIPLVTVTFFYFGWWIYFAFPEFPFMTTSLENDFTGWSAPWSQYMGVNLEDRIAGVFWAAFLLFSWTTASIVSGAVIERIKTQAFLILVVLVGSVTWILDAAWGWSWNGWMVQLWGFHDAYASSVVHGIAGGSALGVLVVLGPRLGKFAADGTPRNIPQNNPWFVTVGLFLIYTGFWGFYAACNVPIIDFYSDGMTAQEGSFFTATTIYLTPTTLSGITFNFLMSLSGGLLAGYVLSKGDPFWSYSGGLAGVITASSGNDLYHPIEAMVIAMVGVWIAYKMHHWVERKFKIDDAVGAVAVHGYAGFAGTVIAGFMLWGYPSNIVGGDIGWFGTNADGIAIINPIGNFLGAMLFFWGLGFLPCWALSKVLDGMGALRVPREVELAGLDTHDYGDSFPYHGYRDTEMEDIDRELAKG
ncbi:MAG: ammonium transporter [Rhodospirillaceae bacterium]|nr:ammonium transporter [Rhodospirillaceae bacterium]|tara:strand:+ start:11266 stop:12672 length:1407 start_codon:yes stop_codon:yes gene_type:complete